MRRISIFLLSLALFIGTSAVATAKHDGNATTHGSVTSIDLGRTTFTIDSKHHGTQTFTLAQRGAVEDNSGQIVGFGALKIGDVVEVRYAPGATLEAARVIIEGTPRHK